MVPGTIFSDSRIGALASGLCSFKVFVGVELNPNASFSEL